MRSAFVALVSLLATTVGCGSSGNTASSSDAGGTMDSGTVEGGGGTDSATQDGGAQDSGMMQVCPSTDAGSPAGYPAAHAPFPKVAYGGGRLITAPEIVTVTFPGDTLAPQLEAFGDQLTQTCYWDAVRDGYCGGGSTCIGRGTVPAKSHVELTSAPASSYADTQGGGASSLQQFVQQQVASGTFPAPDSNTIYAMYFPMSITTSLDGQTNCQTVGGWHNHTTVTPPGGMATDVAYAVVGECSSLPGFSGDALNEATYAASHEISEAVSDPTTSTGGGYYLDRANTDNLAWQFTGGGEIGDMCVDQFGGVFGTAHDRLTLATPGGMFLAQRIWSNTAAALGGDPCMPIGPGDTPYFNVAISAGNGLKQLAIGASATFEVDAFSTAPMAPWTIVALDLSQLQGGAQVVKTSFDKTSVSNGDKMMMTVQLVSQPPMLGGGFSGMPYVIISQVGPIVHVWPGLVVQ